MLNCQYDRFGAILTGHGGNATMIGSVRMKDDKQKIFDLVNEIVGEGGCGAACTDSEIFQEDGEWKLFLCGFLEPWPLGQTFEEVETRLKEYAHQGFGLSAST